MHRVSLFATVAALALGALASPAWAQSTDPNCSSNVMVILDRSTSMYCEMLGAQAKWDIATSALEGVVAEYGNTANFGLTLFPTTTSSCSGGQVLVNPEKDALNDFAATLNANPAGAAMYTPIGEVLEQAKSMPGMAAQTSRRYVILITDGAESCPSSWTDSYWSGNQTSDAEKLMVQTVKDLKAAGITTYVVGFGEKVTGLRNTTYCMKQSIDGVDAHLLNQLAYYGGKPRTADCNATGSDPTSDRNCYYPADDEDALTAALADIAVQITAEVCDGIDNNCNGLIDEDVPPQPCESTCGTGEETCQDGQWVGCTAPQPQPEICDGIDNNCDGQTDEGCDCMPGDTQPCGTDVGECKAGVQKCVNGQWGNCEGDIGPQAEICDGLDNDCDGLTDEDFDCTDSDPPRTCGGPDVGQCKSGTQSCVNCQWSEECVGAIGPTPEQCDGIDNDCDGKTDEPGGLTDDDLGSNLCGDASQVCQNGQCVPVPPQPPTAVVPNGEATGCACRTGVSGNGSPFGGLALALVLGTLLIRRRRR